MVTTILAGRKKREILSGEMGEVSYFIILYIYREKGGSCRWWLFWRKIGSHG